MQKSIVFFWSGLTAYGARALEVLRQVHENTTIVALKSSFPYRGVEDLFKGRIIWVDESTAESLHELCGSYDIVFTSGWGIGVFNRFCNEARARNIPIVCTLDNNWEFSVKMVFKAIRFRLKHRRLYDAFFVPGISGSKLLRFWGVPKNLIFNGFYSGDNKTFVSKTIASCRENKILYVGQINVRKNVIRMCKAFLRISHKYPLWTLEICGRGNLRDQIPVSDKIIVNDFLQPTELAKKYQTAKVFILPSLKEHWGVVVHEAALSGCAMLLSDKVGALPDFVTSKNGVVFNPTSIDSIETAMESVMRWSPEQFDVAQSETIALSKKFSGEIFASNVLKIVKAVGVI